jgi:hypothetical protein
VAATAACCLSASLPLRAQELPFLTPQPAEQKPEMELEPIVVYGGVATPQMWKVSKGDHVLWVLGDAAAPAGAQWRFDQVEARLAESRLLLYPGEVDVDVGFFRIVGLLTQVPLAFKSMTKNPGDKTLKDVLPPEIYERWRVLKAAYGPGDDDIERSRPSLAMQTLEAMIRAKLMDKPTEPPPEEPAERKQSAAASPAPPGPWLRPLVDKAAKKHKVRIRTLPEVELKVEIKNARGMLKFIGAFDQVDVKCVTQKLEYLERTVEYLEQKAVGTTQEKPPARVPVCDEMNYLMSKLQSGEIPDTAGILKMMDTMGRRVKLSNERLDAEWIAAAEAALAKRGSTFAVLQQQQLKSSTGYIAKLRELGYEVEEPDKKEE